MVRERALFGLLRINGAVRPLWFGLVLALLWPDGVFAQGVAYAGGAFGVSTLSADARSLTRPDGFAVSLYKPENGPAVNLFAGVHWNDFLSLQVNYVWNRNRLTTTSAVFSGSTFGVDEHEQNSSQHFVVGDLLLYFRNRTSWARPYLSAGAGGIRFRSHGRDGRATSAFSSVAAGLRVAVGIDLRVHRSWWLRYTFSETLRGNPISERLSPPGQRNLANFQNLAGIVTWF